MRVKRGIKARRRRNRVLEKAKGFRGRSKNTIRQATQRVEKAMTYAYRDRRAKKREFRSIWIVRINAAVRQYGLSYSQFMRGLKLAKVDLDRKSLALLGKEQESSFKALVDLARGKLAA